MITEELEDPTCIDAWFKDKSDFWNSFRALQDRIHYLRECPKTFESIRFPPLPLIQQSIDFNRQFCNWLQANQLIYFSMREQNQLLLDDVNFRYQIWDVLRSSCNNNYNVVDRRENLRILKYYIGEDNFYNGKMPDVAPFYNFKKIR